MKRIALYAAISLWFFLASCKTIVNTPDIVQRTPDIINKPTETILLHDTPASLPRGTEVKTAEEKKVMAVLKEETKVEIREANVIDIIKGKNEKEIVLPKNTEVVLPEETIIKIVESTPIILDAGTETVLPVGTEIQISKINWYALLFYLLAATVSAVVYFKMRSGESEVVETKPKQEKPISTTEESTPSQQ